MKKITFFLATLLCAISVTATDYLGTVDVNTSEYAEANDHVIATITQTGTNVYTMRLDDFSLPLMGRNVNFGAMEFEDLKGPKGKDGYVIASASTEVGWDQLFNNYKLSTLLDRLGILDRLKNIFDSAGELFGGLGNIGNISDYFHGISFPMMITARFNDKELTANMTMNISFSILGRQLMDETVNVHYEGEVPDPAIYLLGSFNDWDEENMLPLTLDNGKWTITQSMGKNAEFKFKDEWGKWIGGVSEGNFIITREQVEDGSELSLAYEEGMNFQMPIAGDWTLAVDKENMKLVVSGQWKEPVYILGEVNENGWAPNVGLEMATEDGITYTAEMTADGRNDGFNYFSFTTRLADNAKDWDAIAPYRFGAVSEGDFWVTDELFDTEFSLTNENGQAYKIGAGVYSLTLNLAEYTLLIKDITPALRGDVNKDGKVDVADVNIAINIVLGRDSNDNYNGRADLDGNDIVDVADVNIMIDIVLGK